MAIEVAPQLDPPPTQARPQRQGAAGWFTRLRRRVKLAMAGENEKLLVTNTTPVSWHIYHKFHLLGILDSGETRLFRLRKTGSLNARPTAQSEESEYLVISQLPHPMR
jgi:hypothetical protein